MADRAEQNEQLTAYLDGELSEAQRADVERLLAGDEDARVLLEELRQTSRLLASLPRGQAPGDLAESVIARLEREALLGDAPGGRAIGARRWSMFHGLAVAAAIALVVTAGWLVLPGLHLGEQAPETLVLAEKERDVVARDIVGDVAAGVAEEERGEAVDDRVAMAKQRGVEITGKPLAKMGAELRSIRPAEQVSPPAKTYAKAGSLREEPSFRPAASYDDLGKGRFERLLAEEVLANSDLRRATAGELTNQIGVETDADTHAKLLRHINSFMASHNTPDVHVTSLPEPIKPSESFYLAPVPAEATPARAWVARREAVQDRDTTHVIVHVPRAQAAALISSMEEVARRNQAPITWTANAVRFDKVEGAPEVIRQLALADQGEGFGQPRDFSAGVSLDAEDDDMNEETGVAADDRRTGRVGESRRREAARRASGLPNRGKEGKKKDAGRRERGSADGKTPAREQGRGGALRGRAGGVFGETERGERTFERTRAEGMVTLAILLHSIQPDEPTRQEAFQPAKAKAGGARPATTQASATSQPTTQGAAGG